jgi:uncharacterized protein
MDRKRIIAKLWEHQAELRSAGILHLRLHGSAARGEASEASDIDLIGDFDRAKNLTLLDMVELEERLADILGRQVDLADLRMLKEPVKIRAEREAVIAF